MFPTSFRDWNPIHLLVEARCLLCGAETHGICDFCLGGIEILNGRGCGRCKNPFTGAGARTCEWCRQHKYLPSSIHCGFAYRGTGQELFRLAKFHGYYRLLSLLFQRFPMPWTQPEWQDFEVICPIPEVKWRAIKRHYHPAGEFARLLSQSGGPPTQSLLKAGIWNKPQVGLDLKLRAKNIEGRFSLKKGQPPKAVILVDDVMTTGATLLAAGQALRKAGCKRLGWICLFRTP